MPFNRVVFLWPRPTKIFGMCHLWHCSNSEQCDTIISRQLSNALTYTHTQWRAENTMQMRHPLCYAIWNILYMLLYTLWCTSYQPPEAAEGSRQKFRTRTRQAGQDQQAVSMWLDSVSMEIEITDKGAGLAREEEGWLWAIGVEKERNDKNPEQQEKWIFGQPEQGIKNFLHCNKNIQGLTNI